MSLTAVLLFAVLGGAAGSIHFALLSRNVELWRRGGSILTAVGLHVGRVGVTVAVLAFAAASGWRALLGCAAALLCARAAVLSRSWSSDR